MDGPALQIEEIATALNLVNIMFVENLEKKMDELFEIAFKGNRRAVYSNSLSLPLKMGDYVIVATERGEHIGKVHQKIDPKSVDLKKKTPLQILRRATEEEAALLPEQRKKEEAAFVVCLQKITERDLVMKLVDVEYQFDGNKITFYFTAEKRVDFRELVKDLAALYKTRIELRQIGVRDEARRITGFGICGRALCCCSFITDFEPITTQLAKDQHLSLSPTKISGACGRLMCCLLFEEEFYKEAIKRFPEPGSKITTDKGVGEVSRIDIFQELIYVTYEDGQEDRVHLSEISKKQKPKRRLLSKREKK
jgi:cell fate regulator YaaT (PSP1 superfamily)